MRVYTPEPLSQHNINTFLAREKVSQVFSCAPLGSQISKNLESDTLPIEPPRHPIHERMVYVAVVLDQWWEDVANDWS